MMAFRLVQISDLHFGTDVDVVVQALRKEIVDLAPQLVVATGDLTQRATEEQFLKAKMFFSSLTPLPLLCCPGNHDISLFNVFSRFFAPYRKFQTILKTKPEGFFSSAELELLILNSTSRFRHIEGALEPKYMNAQLQQFTDSNKWKVVALHHPLDCKQDIDTKNILINAPQAMEAFSQKGVDLVMGGHIHDPFVTTSEQRYPGLTKKMLISVCGTGVSYRVRRNAPNSFTVYDFEKSASKDVSSSITVRRFDYEGKSSLFKAISERAFLK